MGHSKHTTAEELHQLIMTKKTTYASIRKLDQAKFGDLESTMRMLYDHGSVPPSEDGGQSVDLGSVASCNAELSNNQAASKRSMPTKRKTRPDSLTVKPP